MVPATPAPGPSEVPRRATGGKDRTLVAVVWCRQVDNEAESPGYATVPDDFPGRRETLDVCRVVGNLAINAADTHDYWDPDPSNKLAFYHNLFLYPANGGAYTCLGRMFLSTEDRPRLGMKTLVLDNTLLLQQENLGAQIRRWHASMGVPGRTPPNVGRFDPGLLAVLWGALTFSAGGVQRPTLGLVSDNFFDAVETILALLERAPSVLTLLGPVLVFPYFLPASRVNLAELTETFPLDLALFRIPRSEAGGEHHQKRLSAWSAQPVDLLDLTQGTAAALANRPPPGAPVSWWARGDKPEAAQGLRRAIDGVEIPRYLDAARSLERAGGSARRQTIQRVGLSIAAVAKVLDRAPNSRGSVDAETKELARPYLDLLTALPTSPLPAPGKLPAPDVPPPVAVEVPRAPGRAPEEAEPPWRRAQRLRVDRAEVVGVPRDDPGGGAPGAAQAERAPGESPPGVGPEGALPAGLLDEVRRYVDQRLRESVPRGGELEPDVLGRVERELDRKVDARAALLLSGAALDARIVEALSRRPPPEPKLVLTDEVKLSLAQVVNSLVDQKLALVQATASKAKPSAAPAPPEVTPAKVDERVLEAVSGTGTDKRAALQIDQRIQRQLASALADDRQALNQRLEGLLKEIQGRATAQVELEAAIRNEVKFLDEKLQTLMGRLIPLLRKTWLKIDELEKRPSGPGSSDAKMKKLRDELWQEMRRLDQDMNERTRKILDRVEGNMQNQGRLWLALVGQLSSLTEQRRDMERVLEESREDLEPEVPGADAGGSADVPPDN